MSERLLMCVVKVLLLLLRLRLLQWAERSQRLTLDHVCTLIDRALFSARFGRECPPPVGQLQITWDLCVCCGSHLDEVMEKMADEEFSFVADAARAIAAADFVLVAAGAGFSADSGLPVYADVACSPLWKALGSDYQVPRTGDTAACCHASLSN